MSHDSRTWVLLTAEDVESIDFSQVVELSSNSLRWNNDGTKTFVKYEGNKPRFLYGQDTLTHAQIKTELAKSEWIPDDPPE